ncbi:MAG: divergent PAP2 family protein [Defluviitaleaceae bacterium]|nr:divergent PAP2 family protein [Defluviitaleaceae bacterium]
MGYLEALSNNIVLLSAILAWALAQFLKVIIELLRVRRIKPGLMFSTGGMPSSHSSFMAAMATAVGLGSGFDSVIFAVAAAISLVVMSDAAGVRRAAGKQAKVINSLVENIENTGIVLDKKLKELLGHTPIEVACGAILGICIAILLHN